MRKIKKIRNFILVPLLVLNLIVFHFSPLFALAQENNFDDTQQTQQENTTAENSNNDQTENVFEEGESTSEENNFEESNEASTEESQEDREEPIIETGDVNIQIESENDVNSNTVDTQQDEAENVIENTDKAEEILNNNDEGTSTEEETPTEDSGNEELGCEEQAEENCELDPAKVEVLNENESQVENNIVIKGQTGQNSIENSSSSTTTIETGDANVVVGLLNNVNSNIVDSDVSQLLFNIFDQLKENIDLSDEISTSSQSNCATFTKEVCSTSTECCVNLSNLNQNQGEIENNILIEATTGENEASCTENVFIKTGDANVSANIFNLLNTNLVDSNWTQFIINVFDNWMGDLIFPGKEKMEEFLNTQNDKCEDTCQTLISNQNEGQIENKVFVEANTGENKAKGASSTIETGDAAAKVDISNIVNTNLINQNLFFVAINNFGNWKGYVFSLSPSLEMTEDIQGVKIFNLDLEEVKNSSGNLSNNSSEIENQNSGNIENNIIINVLTGKNSATSSTGSVIIETGDANVLANIINVLNSNIVQSNILSGSINIFGNWEGDIAFGRPNLWIGMKAITPHHPAQPGDTITFTLTFMNIGDADATQVRIISDYDERYLEIVDAGGGVIIDNPGEIQWEIGELPVASSSFVSFSAVVKQEIPYGITTIFSTSTISSFEEDWDSENNIDVISIQISRPFPTSPVVWNPSLPKLEITKTHNLESFIYPGDNIDFKIVLYNNSESPAYNVVVSDILFYENEAIKTFSWELGKVLPHEEINIEYTVALGSEALPGIYTNVAEANGSDHKRGSISSSLASTTFEVKLPGEEIEEEIKKEEEELKEKQKETPLSSVEEFISSLPEKLIPEVAAQETSTPETMPEEIFPSFEKGTFERFLDLMLAAIGNFFNFENSCWFFFFSILILIALYLLTEKKTKIKKLILLIILIAFILFYIFAKKCLKLIVIEFVLLILSVGVTYWKTKKRKETL